SLRLAGPFDRRDHILDLGWIQRRRTAFPEGQEHGADDVTRMVLQKVSGEASTGVVPFSFSNALQCLRHPAGVWLSVDPIPSGLRGRLDELSDCREPGKGTLQERFEGTVLPRISRRRPDGDEAPGRENVDAGQRLDLQRDVAVPSIEVVPPT